MSTYGWIIDTDHLADAGETGDAGVMGPRAITPLIETALTNRRKVDAPWKVYTFRMYDDDGILYYTGRMLTDDPDDTACYGPLRDYGEGGAGCVEIRYQGHSEMDIG